MLFPYKILFNVITPWYMKLVSAARIVFAPSTDAAVFYLPLSAVPGT